ncbi:ERF family protein, partial [Escherichia coli]|nr:ERF family protein [Escherichia coli]
MSKEFYARLAAIQENLNAPKNQYNSFGKYKYRSCEDILEGVKPLLNGLFLSISDEVVLIGDRYYVKATATITDGENSHTATALAREEESK